MTRPLRGSNSVSSLSARPRPMMMPPRNWLAAVLGLRMRPQSNEPRKRRTRTSPVTALTRDLGELRAGRVHRVLHLLQRHRAAFLGLDAVAPRPPQDRGVALVPRRDPRRAPGRRRAPRRRRPSARPAGCRCRRASAPRRSAPRPPPPPPRPCRRSASEPPAIAPAGSALSPYSNDTWSSATPSRSAACWACTVAVPMPISWPAVATVSTAVGVERESAPRTPGQR